MGLPTHSKPGRWARSWPFSLSDEEVMLRVQRENDHRAFALLVRRWERPIQRLCARMTGDLHRGEDLAQETFARLFAHRMGYRGGGRFSTFLWRIALNLCCDEHRKSQKRNEVSVGWDDDRASRDSGALAASGPSPDEALVKTERAELVRSALLRLAESYRSVVVLRHYEGLKFGEIAEGPPAGMQRVSGGC